MLSSSTSPSVKHNHWSQSQGMQFWLVFESERLIGAGAYILFMLREAA